MISEKFESLIASGDAVRGTGTWDQSLRKYFDPKVEVTLPTVDATGQLLTEEQKQEFMVKKQELQRRAQGFRPSDPTPNPSVG